MVRFRYLEGWQDIQLAQQFLRRMDTRSGCAINGSSGTAATTRFPSNMEPERPATSVPSIDDPTPFRHGVRQAAGHGTGALSAERQVRHHADLHLPADQGWESAARLGAVGIFWRADRNCFSRSISPWRSRQASITHTARAVDVRWLAAQVHYCATNRSREKVLQPAGTAHLPDLCRLVRRTPRLCGRSALSEEERMA